MNVTLTLGFQGPDLAHVYRALVQTELAGRGLPQKLTLDDKRRNVKSDWLETALGASARELMAYWDEEAGWLSLDKDRIVKLERSGFELEPERLLGILSEVPFTIGSNAELYREWTDGSLGEVYRGPGFAELHWPHGWACFFRGAGHERLVSRRWLDHGPWKITRGANDTTLVEFHELGLDPAAALAKARVGHERMGISPTGGFIQGRYRYAYDFVGKYFPERRKLEIVVIDREVTQREMLDACAARHYQLLGPEQPLDNIVYTFMEEAPARAHLHELWLRGLECRTIIKGEEVDLTATYEP